MWYKTVLMTGQTLLAESPTRWFFTHATRVRFPSAALGHVEYDGASRYTWYTCTGCPGLPGSAGVWESATHDLLTYATSPHVR